MIKLCQEKYYRHIITFVQSIDAFSFVNMQHSTVSFLSLRIKFVIFLKPGKWPGLNFNSLLILHVTL